MFLLQKQEGQLSPRDRATHVGYSMMHVLRVALRLRHVITSRAIDLVRRTLQTHLFRNQSVTRIKHS